MPLFGRKKKEEPELPAKAAQETAKVPEQPVQTPVEQPIQTRARRNAVGPASRPNLEEIQNPDWYLGLRDRMEQFLEFQHRFGFSKESVSGIYDLGQLQNMAEGSILKYEQMQSLKEGMMQSYQEMMEDPSNADKKEMGQNFYEVCSSRAETAERMFAELQNAIAVKIEAINKDPKLAKKNSILQRLRGMKKGSPMMQLLARVKLFKGGGSGELNAIEKAKAMIGDVAEAGIGADNLEAIKTIYEAGADVKDTKEQIEGARDDIQTFIDAVESGSAESGGSNPIKEAFGMVKDTAALVKDTVVFLKDYDKMSSDNKEEAMVSIISKGLSIAASAGGQIVSLLSNIPIVGGIVGLIKNAINFFNHGYQFYKSQQRIKKIRESKRKLKEKMNRRREKYASDPELKRMNLYSYVSKDKDGAVHMNQSVAKKREERGVKGGGMDARNRMKSADKTGRGKSAYYRAKEEETMQEYDEMKEAVTKNKNVRNASIESMIMEGVDVAGNIASFFPGVGSIVQLGAKAAVATEATAHSLGSKARRGIRNLTGHKRSEKNKQKFRNKYAEHIYGRMEEVAEYVDGVSGDLNVDAIPEQDVKGVESSYDYAEGMLESVAANMPALIDSKDKGELLEKLGSAFSREG